MKNSISSAIVVFACIALAVIVCYHNSMTGEFVFDDFQNILTNANIHIDNLSFGTLYDAAFNGPTNRPVAKLSFALNHYFGGLNVFGFHLVNTLIHIANGCLVYLLAQFIGACFLTNQENEAEPTPLKVTLFAFSVALVFVLHPVQTQAVTYIVQRMASLGSLFYFSGLLAFLYGRTAASRQQAIVWWVVMVMSWLFAIGCKEIAVTFPFAVLLLEWFLFRNAETSWIKTGLKYMAGFAVMAILLGFLYKGLDFFELFSRGYSKRDFSLIERLLTEGRIIVHYVSLIVLPMPSRLALVHEVDISKSIVSPISTLACWGAIIGAAGFALLTANRFKVLSFAILWFLLQLSVESTIIPLEIVYEHRLYLPMFGAGILLCFVPFKCLANPRIAMVTVLVFSTVMGYWTYQRNASWQTRISFWEDNLEKFPDSARVNYNVGIEYMKLRENTKAMTYFERTVELEPNLQETYLAIAAIHQRLGERAKAFEQYSKAVAIPKEHARGNFVYDEAFAERGKLYANMGDFENAIRDLNKSIVIDPSDSKAYVVRAGALVFTGEPFKAAIDYEKAIQLTPNSADAHSNYALMLATYPDEMISKPELAISHAKFACELTEWKDYKAMSILAAAYARAGKFSNAISTQNKSVQLAPQNRKKAMQQRLQAFQNGSPLLLTPK